MAEPNVILAGPASPAPSSPPRPLVPGDLPPRPAPQRCSGWLGVTFHPGYAPDGPIMIRGVADVAVVRREAGDLVAVEVLDTLAASSLRVGVTAGLGVLAAVPRAVPRGEPGAVEVRGVYLAASVHLGGFRDFHRRLLVFAQPGRGAEAAIDDVIRAWRARRDRAAADDARALKRAVQAVAEEAARGRLQAAVSSRRLASIADSLATIARGLERDRERAARPLWERARDWLLGG